MTLNGQQIEFLKLWLDLWAALMCCWLVILGMKRVVLEEMREEIPGMIRKYYPEISMKQTIIVVQKPLVHYRFIFSPGDGVKEVKVLEEMLSHVDGQLLYPHRMITRNQMRAFIEGVL